VRLLEALTREPSTRLCDAITKTSPEGLTAD
jgi:hypothetical protein